MPTVRIKLHLTSDTLTVKSRELAPFVGKDVEVTIKAEPNGHAQTARGFMRGTVLRYDDPEEPAAPPEAWEALR